MGWFKYFYIYCVEIIIVRALLIFVNKLLAYVRVHERDAWHYCYLFSVRYKFAISSMKFSGREPTKFVKITTETLSFG
jgi:hypothetical protein